VRSIRTLLKYAYDRDIINRPIKYQMALKPVSKTIERKHSAERPAKEFSVDEIWSLYCAAKQPMKAFILLGLNCGYGTADIGRLRFDQLKFDEEWIGDFRGKTGVTRGAWLWPETIESIKGAIECRPWSTVEHTELRRRNRIATAV
jgi:integrase